jgi:hypothetical protein
VSSDSDKSSFREEFHAAKQTKYDKKFSIRLDQAFKEDSHPAAINCSDIKKKPTPQISIKKNKENNDNLISPRELMVSKEEYIASIREKSRSPRTDEWYDICYEHKNTHYKCEYCGEASAIIEAHDILPYSRLTKGQMHDRGFLKQNLISLCHEHHHNVAHLGDPHWIKFEPRIKEMCEQEKQKRHLEMRNAETQEQMQERLRKAQEYKEHRENLRSIVKNMPGNKIFVEKMKRDVHPKVKNLL